jgi:hypothetical protein
MLSIANFLILLSGAVWVGLDWSPKHKELELALLADQQSPLEASGDITVVRLKRFPDGSELFSVRDAGRFKNASKLTVPIVSFTSQLFIGDMIDQKLQPMSAVAINPPPRPLGYESPSTPIAWTQASYQSQAIVGRAGDDAIGNLKRRGITGLFDRKPQGSISAGGAKRFEQQYLLRLDKSAYIGVVETITIEDSAEKSGLHYFTNYRFEQPDRMAETQDKRFVDLTAKRSHAAALAGE